MAISHDRWFLDRTVRGQGAREHDAGCNADDRSRGGRVGRERRWPTGARYSRYFSEYEEWHRKTLGDAATRPHRVTYRKLTR